MPLYILRTAQMRNIGNVEPISTVAARRNASTMTMASVAVADR